MSQVGFTALACLASAATIVLLTGLALRRLPERIALPAVVALYFLLPSAVFAVASALFGWRQALAPSTGAFFASGMGVLLAHSLERKRRTRERG